MENITIWALVLVVSSVIYDMILRSIRVRLLLAFYICSVRVVVTLGEQ